MNPFQNALSFSEAIKTNREETIRRLMEIRVYELLEDGRKSVVVCLTRWAMEGLNLADDEVILGLAEGLVDDDVNNPDPARFFPA